MLGTNDFQSMHQHNAWHSTQGIAALVRTIRQAPIEPGMPTPDILIVAPPPIQTPKGPMAPKFEGAREKSAGLAEAYRQVATELGCHFLDAGAVTPTSVVDGVHLDADQHQRLGREIAKLLRAVLLTGPNNPRLQTDGAVLETPELKSQDTSDVAGIDVGLTLVHPTSGVCRTGPSGEVVAHTYADRLSRVAVLGQAPALSVVAIDAPLLPQQELHYDIRLVEKVFVWGAFQGRCKPGESHVKGTGQALRRAGAETARSLDGASLRQALPRPFPRVFDQLNIVEAFPNGVLGVSLDESVFRDCPQRNEKFDWLYERWLSQGTLARLQSILNWPREAFWEAAASNNQHDERAAIVCAMTAICVLRGSYVAVGEPNTGFFFLPPWAIWQPWARSALRANRVDARLARPVEVWIDGVCYGGDEDLPD